MKKYLLAFCAVSTLGLTACTTPTGTGDVGTTAANIGLNTATAIGTQAFKYAVNQKCQAELKNHAGWQVLSKTLSTITQTDVETKVCGCVSEKAPQSVTAEELVQAAVDANARTQIIGKTVEKTLTACYTELTKVPVATTPASTTPSTTTPVNTTTPAN